jgi:hypothetical protein
VIALSFKSQAFMDIQNEISGEIEGKVVTVLDSLSTTA